jgi:glycosyltransferase 2 family protein
LIAFAVAAPSSPGFFGVFEAACRLGLGVWDIAPSRVVSFATSYHILTFIPVTLIGLWYLRRFGLSWEDVERGEAKAEETVEALEAGARPGGKAAG